MCKGMQIYDIPTPQHADVCYLFQNADVSYLFQNADVCYLFQDADVYYLFQYADVCCMFQYADVDCACSRHSLKDTYAVCRSCVGLMLPHETVFFGYCCTCSSLKDTRSSMDVNWLNTMALAEGSACSILCTSSLRASILVLLWKSVVLMRLRMLLFLLLRALTGDCSHMVY